MKREKCYLCGSDNYKVIHNGVRDCESIDVLKCNDCGLVFLSKGIDDINGFYENSGMRNGESVDINSIRRAAYRDDLRRYEFTKNMIENKNILDFGCGAGGYVQLAKQIAARVECVEPEMLMNRVLSEEGFCCYQSVEDIKKKYDIITMFHVLEHLENPVGILKMLKDCLNDNGRIIIEVPNADDALLNLYGCSPFEDFSYWSCHLFLFNFDTLKILIKMAGYKIGFMEQIQRYPLANHLYWLSRGKAGGHQEWSFLTDDELDVAYGKKLAQLGCADTIIIGIER